MCAGIKVSVCVALQCMLGVAATLPLHAALDENAISRTAWKVKSRTFAVAKTNPEYIEYLRSTSLANSSSTNRSFGWRPSNVDYSYLRQSRKARDNGRIRVKYTAGGAASHIADASYDLRTKGWVTSVKNQNPFATCWAHATMGSLESGILKRTGEVFDFSEKHLVNRGGYDNIGYDEDPRWDHPESNADNSIAYLTRWAGPVGESEDRYPQGKYSVTASPVGTPLGHVQNVIHILPMPAASEFKLSDTEDIKRAVCENGGVYASYMHNDDAYSFVTHSYYWDGSASNVGPLGGHAVLIVGWDDGYDKNKFASSKCGRRPPGNGAFLIKNSWGTDWGDGGYDWVSYYDACLGRSEVYSFCNFESVDNYDGVYYHDKFGLAGNVDANWFANMFVARDDDEIAAVGMFSPEPGTAYEIKVYTNCSEGRPVSGTASRSTMGNMQECGFFTIPLSDAVPVASGSRFSVVVRLSPPTYTSPTAVEYAYRFYVDDDANYYAFRLYDYEENVEYYYKVGGDQNYVYYKRPGGDWYSVSLTTYQEAFYMPSSQMAEDPRTTTAGASAGESFVSDDGIQWDDLTTVFHPTANVCCKAYARSHALPAPSNVHASRIDESNVTVSWDSSAGADGYNIYRSGTANRPAAPYRRGETSPFHDYDALVGREYWYWVEATNATRRAMSEGVKGWRPPYLEVSLSQSFPGEGGTTNIWVDSTASWSAEADSNWIRIATSGVNELIYSVDQNPTGENRSGHIIVTSPDDDGAAHKSVSEITVFQQGYIPPDAPNDDIKDAIPLGSAASGETTGSNYGATIQPDSPVYERTVMYSEFGTNSVWWTWTAPDDGTVTFSLEGSSLWDIVVATYNPSSTGLDAIFGPFKKVAQSYSAQPCNADVTAGTTYYLRVSGMLGTFGTFKLSWSFKSAGELIETWYVDAKWGSDSNDGLSWGSPLKTISAAVGKVEKGGTIYVNDGVYEEYVNAMFKYNLTIRSVNGASKTVIDGKGQTMISCVQLADSSALVGFTVRNGGGYRGGGACGGFLHQCVLSNNVARIQGGGAYSSVLSNCLIVNNSAPEGGGTFQCELTNCTVVCNSASSTCGGTYSGRAYNSIVWGNTLTGSGTAVNYLSTTFRYSCTSPAVSGTGNIDEDPCLVASGGTYVLDETSPCINAGANGYATAIGDVFGNTRIYGSAVDMGAAESPYLQRVIRKPECDVGFYTFSNYGWSYPLCLSSTNLASMAFVPEYAFFAGAGPVLNCCAVNYSSKPATVEGLGMSIWDMDGNLTGETVEAISDTINAGGGFNFRNRNLNAWQGGLAPGNYRLMVILDPDDKLGDPDRSNNATSIWFAVKAQNISLNDALGCTALDFVSSGIYAPFVQTSESVSGGSCVQFGPQPGGSYYNTCLETSVPGAGRLSFKWKSSAYSSQYLVLINRGDGSVMRYIDQTATEWQSSYVDFSEAGTVYWQLWTYPGKPDDLSAAWLDDVQWTPLGSERDVSFYAPPEYGWSRPLFLSSTSSEWLSYAPSSTLLEDAPVFLNFCAWNKTIWGEAFLSTVRASVVDDAGVVVTNETLDINGSIGVGEYYEFNNIPVRSAANLPPGTYDLVLELDPSDLLKDPDRSNNVTSVLFTVLADNVTIASDVTGGKPLDVPHGWFKQFPGFREQFGDDLASALRMNTGKRTSSGEMMCVWQDYVAGTDPTDTKDVFKAFISFTNGMPCINWTPDLNANGATVRTYTIEGRESLSHGTWEHPTNSTHRFFRVKVDVP